MEQPTGQWLQMRLWNTWVDHLYGSTSELLIRSLEGLCLIFQARVEGVSRARVPGFCKFGVPAASPRKNLERGAGGTKSMVPLCLPNFINLHSIPLHYLHIEGFRHVQKGYQLYEFQLRSHRAGAPTWVVPVPSTPEQPTWVVPVPSLRRVFGNRGRGATRAWLPGDSRLTLLVIVSLLLLCYRMFSKEAIRVLGCPS